MRTEAERFWSFVVKTNTCWLWTGGTNGVGYGTFRVGSQKDGTRRHVLAHRWAYKDAYGHDPINQLDHLCRNRSCVRPSHLEDVTQRENLLRGDTIPAQHAAKKVCGVCGAPYKPPNSRGQRVCTMVSFHPKRPRST